MALPKFERRLQGIVDARAQDYNNITKGIDKTEVGRNAEAAFKAVESVPVDDGVSTPQIPTGITVEPVQGALKVRWAAPLVEDGVAYTEVRYTRVSDSVERTLTSGALSLTITGLPRTESYKIELRHINQWGRAGEWALGSTGSVSEPTVAERIDFAQADILGSLGWENMSVLEDGTYLGEGTITYQNMAVQNSAMLNTWIENAAIDNALIKDLAADKIVTGELDADLIVTGAIHAGGTIIDETGVTLEHASQDTQAFPSTHESDWITGPTLGGGPNPYAGLGFIFDQNTGSGVNARGIVIAADGVINDPDFRGRVIIRATSGNKNPTSNATAQIRVDSGGNWEQKGTVAILGRFVISPQYGELIPQIRDTKFLQGGESYDIPHNFGAPPTMIFAQTKNLDQTNWRIVANGITDSGMDVQSSSGYIRVINRTSSGQSIRINAFR